MNIKPRNFVTKHMKTFSKSVTMRDRSKFNKKEKHKNKIEC